MKNKIIKEGRDITPFVIVLRFTLLDGIRLAFGFLIGHSLYEFVTEWGFGLISRMF